jgi:hypothetical protein
LTSEAICATFVVQAAEKHTRQEVMLIETPLAQNVFFAWSMDKSAYPNRIVGVNLSRFPPKGGIICASSRADGSDLPRQALLSVSAAALVASSDCFVSNSGSIGCRCLFLATNPHESTQTLRDCSTVLRGFLSPLAGAWRRPREQAEQFEFHF